MAKQEGFHIADHELFPILEFKLGDKSISAEALVRAAEQMRLELLKHGLVVQVQSKTKQNR
jgi:hypothetical protein